MLKFLILVSRFALLMISVGAMHTLGASAYAQLSSLQTQIPTSSGPSSVKMEISDVINNLEISATKDKVTIKENGVYFVLVSAQIGAISPSATGHMDLWFTKNGKPVSNSNVRMTIDDPSSTDVLISQIVIKLLAGETLGCDYSASRPSLGFIFSQPDNEPAIPSILFSIFKLDAA